MYHSALLYLSCSTGFNGCSHTAVKVTHCSVLRSTGIALKWWKKWQLIWKEVCYKDEELQTAFTHQKSSSMPWLSPSEELQNRKKEIWVSGFASSVNVWSMELQHVFFLLLLNHVTVRPWENKLCRRDQGLTQSLSSAKKAVWSSCFQQLLPKQKSLLRSSSAWH